MDAEQRKAIMLAAIEKNGMDRQLNMVLEEAGEIIVAVSHLRRGRVTSNEVIGEIVDMEIVLAQLKIIIDQHEHRDDVDARVDTAIVSKLQRLHRRNQEG